VRGQKVDTNKIPQFDWSKKVCIRRYSPRKMVAWNQNKKKAINKTKQKLGANINPLHVVINMNSPNNNQEISPPRPHKRRRVILEEDSNQE